MAGLFSKKHDGVSTKYQRNGQISIDTIPQQQARQSHNGKSKKGDTYTVDDPKSKGKDNNTGDTAGVHVGDFATTEQFTAPSGGASKFAHFLETNEQLSYPSHTMEEILGAQPMNNDAFWNSINPSDLPIYTIYSKELFAGSHIKNLHTHQHEELVSLKLLNKVPNVPQACDLAQKYHLHSLNKSKDSNMLSKTNNTTHAKGINLLSQEPHDYYFQHDQQFVACKHDGDQEYYNQRDQQFVAYKYDYSLKRPPLNWYLTLLQKKKKMDFINEMTSKIGEIITPAYLRKKMKKDSNTINVDNSVFNRTITKHKQESKSRIVSEVFGPTLNLPKFLIKSTKVDN